MVGFALVPDGGGAQIALEDGKVTVGRGPFLRIVDKRVSRHHAIIKVSDSTATILPIHTNPTFYKANNAIKFETLEKNCPKELHNGDFISFLPNDVIFQVKKKDSNNIESSGIKSKTNEDIEIEEDKEENKANEVNEIETVESNRNESSCNHDNDDGTMVVKKEETLEVGQLLKKTRNLPSWMKQVQDESSKKKSKAAEKKMKQNKASQKSTETVTKNENVEKCGKAEDLDENVMETKDPHSVEDLIEKQEKSNKRKIRKQPNTSDNDEVDDNDNNGDDKLPTTPAKPLPSCPYGTNCYRKNPVHFQEYSHNQLTSDQSDDMESDNKNLPECPHGIECYRKNPQHRKDYRHTATPNTRERRAKKAKVKDDEDSENDYDYNDSFINDESDSSCEPSDVEDNESDWHADDDELDREVVTELVSEAKRFTKNKRMLKPT